MPALCGEKKEQKKKELCRDSGVIQGLTSRQTSTQAGWVGWREIIESTDSVHGGVSLERQRSSRSPWSFCLLVSSVTERCPRRRTDRETRESEKKALQAEREGGGERWREDGRGQKLKENRKKQDKGGENEAEAFSCWKWRGHTSPWLFKILKIPSF